MPIGQLWYTWSERGLEGFSRFQIVACSEAVDGRMADFVATARRLCSYPDVGGRTEDEPPPVSFGWTDVGRTRYAFARTHLRGTEADRRTSFAAHVLFGGFAEMDLGVLLGTAGTDLWWAGDLRAVPEDGRLQRVTPEQLQRASASTSGNTPADDGTDPVAVAAAVAACCFGGPVGVASMPLLTALRRVADAVPELADVGSFSSFEGAPNSTRAAEEFWAFGVGTTAPSHPALQASPTSAALLTTGRWMNGPSWERMALQAAWADTAGLPDQYTGWLSLIAALSTPLTGDVDWTRLLPVFTAPATFAALLERTDARAQLADRLVGGDDQLIHPFLQAAGPLSASLHRLMAESLAAAALDRSARAAAVVEIGRGLPARMRDALLTATSQRLRRHPEKVQHWPPDLLLQLARRESLHDLPAPAAGALLAGLAPVGGTVLADPLVDADLRSALFHRRVSGGLRLPGGLLARDPVFTAALVRSAPGDDVLTELDTVTAPVVLRLLGDPASGIPASRAARLLTRTCERMQLADRVQELLSLKATAHGRALVERAGAVLPTCQAFTTAYLTDGRMTADFQRLALLAAASPAGWADLFQAVDTTLARPPRTTRSARLPAAVLVEYGVGADGFALQFDAFACTADTAEQIRSLADDYLALQVTAPEWVAMERSLVAAIRSLRLGRHKAALACVLYVAEDFAGDRSRRTAPTGVWSQLEPLAVKAWRQLHDGPDAAAVKAAITTRAMRSNREARRWLSNLG